MDDLITKLQDLNRIDPLWDYTIQIVCDGSFILHGVSPNKENKKEVRCTDTQCLREEMYRIILNCVK